MTTDAAAHKRIDQLNTSMSACKLEQEKGRSTLSLRIQKTENGVENNNTIVHQLAKSLKETGDKIDTLVISVKPVVDSFNKKLSFWDHIKKDMAVYIGGAILLAAIVIVGKSMINEMRTFFRTGQLKTIKNERIANE